MGVIRGKRESMLQRQRDEEKLMGARTLHSGCLAAENGGGKRGNINFQRCKIILTAVEGKLGRGVLRLSSVVCKFSLFLFGATSLGCSAKRNKNRLCSKTCGDKILK